MVTGATAAAGEPASFTRRAGLAAASAAIGLVLALVALCLAPTPSVRLDGSQFQVREGTGRVVGSSLEVASPGGQIVLVAALPELPAYRYAKVAFRASGLEGAQSASVFWIARSAPTDAHPRALSQQEIKEGRTVLARDDRWRGDMTAIGFLAEGPMRGPIRLDGVEIQPGQLGWDETLGLLLRNAMHVEGWSGGSVNFHVGALRSERRLTPVVLMTLWAGLACLVYSGLSRLARRHAGRPSWRLVLLTALLLGMAVLDMRWQLELLHRAGQTLAAGGRPPDFNAQQAFSDMRARIQDQQARIVVVSDDPTGYAAQRARYHLLPLRTSFGIDRLPTAAQARPGDYLLLLSYRGAIRYDPAQGLLLTAETTLGVELLARSPEAGALFRIRSAS